MAILAAGPLTFRFSHCRLDYWPQYDYAETVFEDGASVAACPMHTGQYRATARDLGYGSDLALMSLHHEFMHSFLAEIISGSYSPTLWNVAHGIVGNPSATADEEARVLGLQRMLMQDREFLRRLAK
jgi:hypothetical protein